MSVTKHKHQIIDSDAHFTIDAISRNIVNDNLEKNVIIQGDHNSERFTFAIPRYIDGHDMLLCNHVQVAYIDTQTSGRSKQYSTGVYLVSDLDIHPTKKDYLQCSWVISHNATRYEGALNFMLIMSCMEGELVTYRWKTNVFEGIHVAVSLDSNLVFEDEYVDIIEQWKNSVMEHFTEYVDAGMTYKAALVKEELSEDLSAEFADAKTELSEHLQKNINVFNETLDNEITEMHDALDGFDDILETELTKMDGSIDVLKARMDTFTALGEGSTTGDAELIDARVGADGTVYDTLGKANREQFSKLDLRIYSIDRVDYSWISNGYISPDGIIIEHEDYVYTDYIDLYKGNLFIPIYYDLTLFKNTAVGLYDSDKNLIRVVGTDSETLTRVTGLIGKDFGAHYIRACCYKYYSGSLTRGPIDGMDVKLQDDCVTTNTIADGAITLGKLANYKHVSTSNYIDKNSLIVDAYINDLGEIKKTIKLSVTDKIPMNSDTVYYWSGVFTGYYAFYAEDDSVIEAHGNDTSLSNPFTPPVGTAYGRFTIQEAYVERSWINIRNEEPPVYTKAVYDFKIISEEVEENPTDYVGCDICTFTRGLCVGDSLTAGTMNYYTEENGIGNYLNYDKYSFPRNLERMTGITVTNMGLGGKTSDEWYESQKDTDLSGYDFAIVQLGVNDVFRHDGWTTASVEGFTNIINKLRNENSNIKIFVSTIIPAMSYSGELFDAVSQGIRNLVLTLDDPNVILLDMAVYGHTGDLEAYDCGHLSAYGYWRLAADYKSYISWYMHNNPNLFREIQFIGTEYKFEQ